MSWKNLDTAALLAQRQRQHEATMSGNVGAFAVPLGGILRPPAVGPVDPTDMTTPSGYSDLDSVLDAYAKASKPKASKKR